MIPESQKLEPCPFCGGDAKIVDATQVLGSWKVIHRCKVVGYLCIETSERDQAIVDWNTRLTRQEDARKAALEEALEPIAMLAADSEWNDVPDDHAAGVVYRSEAGGEETVGSITFGDLRRIRAIKEAGHG